MNERLRKIVKETEREIHQNEPRNNTIIALVILVLLVVVSNVQHFFDYASRNMQWLMILGIVALLWWFRKKLFKPLA